jgi:ketosteroid isomerase-like protein
VEAQQVSEHENAAVIRFFFAAFATDDYEPIVRECLAHDVEWHVAGNNPLAGDFIGVDAVLSAMRRYSEHSRRTLQLDTRSVFADEHHAVAVHWATAQREGITYQAHEIDVFHLSSGLITEFWSFSEDQDATDALWS